MLQRLGQLSGLVSQKVVAKPTCFRALAGVFRVRNSRDDRVEVYRESCRSDVSGADAPPGLMLACRQRRE
jgi:hypothetical protein